MKIEQHTIDGNQIQDWASFHAAFSTELDFPDYYGNNMDAWIDCMSDLYDKETLAAITIKNAASLKERKPEIYNALVECSAFVNWRLTAEGNDPVIALAFYV